MMGDILHGARAALARYRERRAAEAEVIRFACHLDDVERAMLPATKQTDAINELRAAVRRWRANGGTP